MGLHRPSQILFRFFVGFYYKVVMKWEVIYQTRETVFHRDIQTPRRELKIRRAAEYF